MQPTRRQFVQSTASASLGVFAQTVLGAKSAAPDPLAGQFGVTTGSFMRHLSPRRAKGKLVLLDLPAIMRDELDMRVIDLMTRTLASFEPKYLEEFRSRAEKAGCIITNLKMNHKGLEPASLDESRRRRALDEYKRTIDAAEILGCRWVRPLPAPKRPNLDRLAAGHNTT